LRRIRSDDCTRRFFASGSAGCSSSCFVVPIVALPVFIYFVLSVGGCHAEVLRHLVELLVA
jgi:hypothetical protein